MLKLPYYLNVSSPRPRLIPTLFVCITLLAYLGLVWITPPKASFVPVPPSTTSSENKASSRILLVSAFFPLGHAKHSHDDYKSWLKNFLGPEGVQCDLYFYTTPDLEQLILSLGSSSTHTLTINTTYKSPFDIPPLSNYREKYTQMHAWDRERSIHSPELYAVWNAKPWLLEHALTNREHDYDYAFWVDAGSFRTAHPFRKWPDPTRTWEVFSTRREGEVDDRVLIPLYKLPGLKQYAWRVEKGPVDMDFSEGSFFGSTPSGVSWFAKAFYEAHDRYINTPLPLSTTPPSHIKHPHEKPKLEPHDPASSSIHPTPQFHFVGKDQTIINTLLFRYPTRFLGILNPARTYTLPPLPTLDGHTRTYPRKEPPYILTLAAGLGRAQAALLRLFGRATACGDWYYYQWWLATSDERERARGMGWERCGDSGTKVIRIDDLLRGLFGSRWVESRMAGGG